MITVRFTRFNRADQLVTQERTFKTQAAWIRFLEAENSPVVSVLAFAN